MHDGLHVRGCRVGEPSPFPSVCLDDKFSTLFVGCCVSEILLCGCFYHSVLIIDCTFTNATISAYNMSINLLLLSLLLTSYQYKNLTLRGGLALRRDIPSRDVSSYPVLSGSDVWRDDWSLPMTTYNRGCK